ncbi:glycosyltransferase family 2 protein [Deinococcus kurensis]|uniref:glycosyltransferase family 2 protein n=1 Tax=Deinococcus kurensis TaxID=2662757 RepID=UPI0013914601|nr:glycosyltransferase family 2 protein [Deinococcus kurensis]
MISQVAVVLLNWKGAEDTIKCCKSLEDSGILAGDIYIVDNDSPDDSEATLKTALPGSNVIQSGRNGGFSWGCNVGIRAALEKHYEYIWLLNNDTTVDDKTLPNIINKAQAESLGITGCTIRDMHKPHNLQMFGGGRVNFLTGTTYLNKNIHGKLDFVSGASMLISREVIESIGLLDEGYMMYWEDVEYSIRALKAGYRINFSSEAIVYHKDGGSVGRRSKLKARYITASTRRFFKQTSRSWMIPIMYQQLGRSIMSIKRREFEFLKEIWS